MKRLVAVALFQVVVMLGWAAQHEYVRATAPTFRIPLAPRDPYDVLRGRYFVMNPKDANVKTGSATGSLLTAESVKLFLGDEASFEGPAQVGFCPQADTFRVCALARLAERPNSPARYWSRARLFIVWEQTTWREGKNVPEPGYRVDVGLGLDRFFLPNRAALPGPENADGWEVEVSHRPGLTPLPRRLFFKQKPVVLD